MASPDPDSTSFRFNCKAIEDGNFVNDSLLSFVENMLGEGLKKQPARSAKAEKSDSAKEPPNTSVSFTSYEEYMKGNETTMVLSSAMARDYHRSSVLLDSLLSFAGRSAMEVEEQEISDEDTPLVAGDQEEEDVVSIDDEDSPLAVSSEKSRWNWWWLLIVAACGAAGVYVYEHNKKKQAQTNVESDKDSEN